MSRVFLVTGFPRSRTAWMAAYLSGGDTLCMHEPILQCGRQFTAMVEFVASLPHENIGISDSAIGGMLALYRRVYQEAPTLIVERNKQAALQDHLHHFGGLREDAEKAFDEIERGLQALIETFPNVKRISFESLETVEGAQAAWEFCCPSTVFDPHRYQAMNRIVCNPKY